MSSAIIAKDKESPLKLAAIERQARMEGWHATSRSIIKQRIVPASVMKWLQEVHTNIPSTVKRAKKFGPGGKEAMLRAIAYSKAGERRKP